MVSKQDYLQALLVQRQSLLDVLNAIKVYAKASPIKDVVFGRTYNNFTSLVNMVEDPKLEVTVTSISAFDKLCGASLGFIGMSREMERLKGKLPIWKEFLHDPFIVAEVGAILNTVPKRCERVSINEADAIDQVPQTTQNQQEQAKAEAVNTLTRLIKEMREELVTLFTSDNNFLLKHAATLITKAQQLITWFDKQTAGDGVSIKGSSLLLTMSTLLHTSSPITLAIQAQAVDVVLDEKVIAAMRGLKEDLVIVSDKFVNVAKESTRNGHQRQKSF